MPELMIVGHETTDLRPLMRRGGWSRFISRNYRCERRSHGDEPGSSRKVSRPAAGGGPALGGAD